MRLIDRPDGLDHPIVPKILRLYSQANVWLYRKSGGKLGNRWRVGSAFPWGLPVILLTTIGRKSGLPRTTPLIYMRDGANYVVVASQGGLPKHPQWYLNVQANAGVEVQDGGRIAGYSAHIADADERAELWPRLVELYADFAQYQAWAERVIPVVVLKPE